VKEHFKKTKSSKICDVARQASFRYAMTGGVSEWRYKTGIDGEPAVSKHHSMYACHEQNVIWSATASSNDAWKSSVGTTAQAIVEKMFDEDLFD
jgi:hypothetical protein